MNYKLLYIIFSALLLSCNSRRQDFEIIPLNKLNYLDTISEPGRTTINIGDCYLVRGYKDNQANLTKLDSFAHKQKSNMPIVYSQYTITFYKESAETNLENMAKYPQLDGFPDQSDEIYSYLWISGRFAQRYKYKNGKIVEPSTEIILSPAPESKK